MKEFIVTLSAALTLMTLAFAAATGVLIALRLFGII